MFAALFFTNPASACLCPYEDITTVLDESDFVYIGLVTESYWLGGTNVQSKLEIHEKLKGIPSTQFMNSTNKLGSCSAIPIVGEKYLVIGQHGQIPELKRCSLTNLILFHEDTTSKVKEILNDSQP